MAATTTTKVAVAADNDKSSVNLHLFIFSVDRSFKCDSEYFQRIACTNNTDIVRDNNLYTLRPKNQFHANSKLLAQQQLEFKIFLIDRACRYRYFTSEEDEAAFESELIKEWGPPKSAVRFCSRSRLAAAEAAASFMGFSNSLFSLPEKPYSIARASDESFEMALIFFERVKKPTNTERILSDTAFSKINSFIHLCAARAAEKKFV